ncbi:MAG TPA: D-amino acid aminotransferase [Vicinamibacterales bacterium]
MPGAVYVNGRIVSEGDAVVPVLDHGFLFGEGVYEVCCTYGGRPFLLDRHLARLRRSAALIALDVPPDAELAEAVAATLRAGGFLPWRDGAPEAYVRLIVTRGVGEITYDPASCPAPTVVVIARPHTPPPPEAYERGVRVALVDVERNRKAALNPLIKSNNLLNNALAMQQAIARGAFEAVMRNYTGRIAECSQSNLFVVRNGVVSTPPLDAGLLPGITRAFVLELCLELGIPAAENDLDVDGLLGADEAFLTSTTREIVPIVQVDDAPIGDGRPGPVTARLLEAFRARVHARAEA